MWLELGPGIAGTVIGSRKGVRLILLWLRLVFILQVMFVGVWVCVASNEDPAEENPTRIKKQRKGIDKNGKWGLV